MYTLSSRLVMFLSAAVLAVSALFIGPLFASAHGDIGKKESPHSVGSTLEVRIGDDNSALVRGAKVTAVSGSVISAQTSFGSTALSWSVKTDGTTAFTYVGGASAPLSAIAVGDYISFSGTIDTGASGLTVNAKSVKDWSKSKIEKPVSWSGPIQSINAANLSFTLASGNPEGVITVKLASSAVITDGDKAFAFAHIAIGDQARVSGTYDAASKTLTADKVTVTRVASDGHKTFTAMIKALGDRFQFHFSFRK